MPIKELEHTTFVFSIGEVSFSYKLFAVVDSDYTVMPCAEITTITPKGSATATGFRLGDLCFLNKVNLIAVHQVMISSIAENEGYARIRIRETDISLYLLRNFSIRLVISGEDEYLECEIAGEKVKIRTKLDLHHLINIVPSINEHIRWMFTKFEYWDKFYSQFHYDAANPDHQPLGKK